MISKEKHNGIISFWKFMFCLMILALHVGQDMETNVRVTFAAGSIGVQYFFIVSGYLLGKKTINYRTISNNELGEETFKYVWKKIKNFFPYMLFTYTISLPIITYRYGYHKNHIINSIWDLLFLRGSGIRCPNYINVSWYISAMLICMLILFPMVLKLRRNFTNILGPLIVIFLGGYLSNKYSGLGGATSWTKICYKGILIALLGLTIGILTYCFSEKIKHIKFTNLSRILLTIIEFVGLSSVFFVVNIKDAHQKYDFIILLILSICIAIAFSEKSLLLKFCNNKIFYFFEKLSLPIYLNHMVVLHFFNWILEKKDIKYINYYIKVLIIIFLTMLVSVLCLGLIKSIKKSLKRIKKYFIII